MVALTNDDGERINRYLHGEMTQEEEMKFEDDLAKDDALRQQAEAMARMVKSMEKAGAEHDKLLVEKMKASAVKKPTTVWWISMAAGLAIILSLGYHLYDYSSTTRLGQQYACTFPMSEIIRGEEDEEVTNTLTILFDNVANGKKLDNTIVQLADLWELSQSDTYNSYSTYEPYIGWNLAIAYLRNNDKDEAVITLDRLVEIEADEENAIWEKAIELKEKL